MPAKSKSPEAAQKKVWKAELRDHKRGIAKIKKDHAIEKKRILREISMLELKRHRMAKIVERELANTVRRIAILEGRLGV